MIALALQMPLVILCGFPASGKTTLATKLSTFLKQNTQMTVQVVNDEFLNIPNNDYYSGKLIYALPRLD